MGLSCIVRLESARRALGGSQRCHRRWLGPCGRALAPSFWQQARKGLAGIVETGCLSTSTDKAVAKQYAQSSSAKLLFELQLGYVARGADLARIATRGEKADSLCLYRRTRGAYRVLVACITLSDLRGNLEAISRMKIVRAAPQGAAAAPVESPHKQPGARSGAQQRRHS